MLEGNLLYVQEEMTGFIESPFFQIHPFFVILFGGMLIYMLLLIWIPLLTMITNMVRNYYKRGDDEIAGRYKKTIFEYLASPGGEIPLFENSGQELDKEVMLDIVYELIKYVDGEDKQRLRVLFDDLQLGKYILRRINNPLCFRKGYYLEHLVALSNINSSDIPFKKMLNSRSPELRLYAMEAYMTIYPDKILPLFESYKFNLSLWEQINYYNFFVTKDIKIPDFHTLALSSNDSVALFAIRMVRMFKQQQRSIAGYESLLEHPNMEVRFEMFRALAEFGYDNLDELFSDFMARVPLQIRMHIITYLSKTNHMDTASLMKYYRETDDPDFRLHVLYCIYNFIQGGREDIERFGLQEEDRELHDLSIHLITNIL